jgi:hypothetical protein
MTLGAAAAGTPVGAYVKPGKAAMAACDRSRVDTVGAANLRETAGLEAAFKSLFPQEPHWDYAAGWTSNDCELCCYIEVHSANTEQVDAVIAKKKATEARLKKHAPQLYALGEQSRTQLGLAVWHWVATDARVRIHANMPAARRLAAAGIGRPVRKLVLG